MSTAEQTEIIDWEHADNRRFTLEYTVPALEPRIGPSRAGGRVLSVGCGVGTDVQTLVEVRFGQEPGGRLLGQVSGASFLSRVRLKAAAASSSCCWIFHWPTCLRRARLAMVLSQPKHSSTFLRQRWLS